MCYATWERKKEEKIAKAGIAINDRFENINLSECVQKVKKHIIGKIES